jgi:hypothetical protein
MIIVSFIISEQEKETETFLDYVRIVRKFSKLALASPQRWHLAMQLAAKDYQQNISDSAAMASAEKLRFVGEPNAWRRNFRANLICDLADGTDFLEDRSVPMGAIDFSHSNICGAWPSIAETGPFVALSAHWGSGVGALRHLQQNAGACSLFVGHDLKASRTHALHIAAMRRLEMIERLTTMPTTGIDSFVNDFDRHIENGVIPVIHFEIASRPSQRTIRTRFNGLELEFPSGALWHIARRRLPVVFYSGFRDPNTGVIHISIDPVLKALDFEVLTKHAAKFLITLIHEHPYFWQSWATPTLFPELLAKPSLSEE